MLAFATFLLCFDPLHQAYHLGNVVLFVVPLSFWSILLAERDQGWWAGLILGFVAALKPQIGIWILLYYLLRRRRQVVLGASAAVALVSAILLLRPLPLSTTIASYRANLQHWFAPGHPYGFTEGALAFHVNNIQVILYRLLHNVFTSNLLAHALFLSGLVVWTLILWRAEFRIPAPLAISSLLALSFLSLYHSVSDVTILTLALGWVVSDGCQAWTRTKTSICILFFLLMMPGHSFLMRLTPHLDASVTTQWWWTLFVARYFVWLLLTLSIALLAALRQSADGLRELARC